MEKVECGKCQHIIRRSFCMKKEIKVSRKGLHECGLFETRDPSTLPPTVYIPNVDKATAKRWRRALKKAAAYAVENNIPLADVKVGPDGVIYEKKQYQMPASTAGLIQHGEEPIEHGMMADPEKVQPLGLGSIDETDNNRD